MDGLQKRLPYSIDGEQSVLGSILINPECFEDVARIVKADDFYHETHKRIFEVMQDFNIASKPLDIVTLANMRGFLRTRLQPVPTLSSLLI